MLNAYMKGCVYKRVSKMRIKKYVSEQEKVSSNKLGGTMEKIASFTIDHDVLVPGFYISRIDGDTFLERFDTDWKRYNRDLIRKVQQYQTKKEGAQ